MTKYYDLKENEKKAIKFAVEELGYYDVAKDEENLAQWYDDDTISIGLCRNGREVAWVIVDEKQVAIYTDTFELLNEKEIENQLL